MSRAELLLLDFRCVAPPDSYRIIVLGSPIQVLTDATPPKALAAGDRQGFSQISSVHL
jgi:hypothetical protein